jgi:glucose-6-phosphate 1-dehydrogenase
MSTKGFSRMIVEKPFGEDLDSCKEILARVRGLHDIVCLSLLVYGISL